MMLSLSIQKRLQKLKCNIPPGTYKTVRSYGDFIFLQSHYWIRSELYGLLDLTLQWAQQYRDRTQCLKGSRFSAAAYYSLGLLHIIRLWSHRNPLVNSDHLMLLEPGVPEQCHPCLVTINQSLQVLEPAKLYGGALGPHLKSWTFSKRMLHINQIHWYRDTC